MSIDPLYYFPLCGEQREQVGLVGEREDVGHEEPEEQDGAAVLARHRRRAEPGHREGLQRGRGGGGTE